VGRDNPSSRDLWVRLEAKISEARRALVETAAATALRGDQEAAYQRLVAALDELLVRIRTTIPNEPAPLPPQPTPLRRKGETRSRPS